MARGACGSSDWRDAAGPATMTPRKRTPEPDPLLRVSTVARRLNVHEETVRSWIRAKKIAFVRTPTGFYRIPTSAMNAILKINTQDSQSTQTR